MNVIVLGGTGYLGSKVINRLIERGHNIVCIKRKKSKLSALDNVLERVVLVDVDDFSNFIKDSEVAWDCFLNMACMYHKSNIAEEAIFDANFNVPMQIFLACYKNGVKKNITVGTSLERDVNLYALSKWMYADLGKWYCYNSESSIEFCNVKLESFYGKDEPQDRFIPSTINKLKRNEKILLTEGSQKRDYIDVEDVINALTVIVEKEKKEGYIDFPLGSGENASIREMIEYLHCILSSKSELCFGALEKRKNEPDTKADCRLMKEYGIAITHTWREGFKKLI